MMSIGPQTYPHIHAGYEYLAKEFIGFTHTRIEGVGCLGSGGNILIKPIVNGNSTTQLLKKKKSRTRFLQCYIENGIQAQMQVKHNGLHQYLFPWLVRDCI
jgi:putative alpha-1,2-mannosidase